MVHEFIDLSPLEKAGSKVASTSDAESLLCPASGSGKRVIIHKFYLEISQYPNGMMYPKITPVGSKYKEAKKRKARKPATKVIIGKVEEH